MLFFFLPCFFPRCLAPSFHAFNSGPLNYALASQISTVTKFTIASCSGRKVLNLLVKLTLTSFFQSRFSHENIIVFPEWASAMSSSSRRRTRTAIVSDSGYVTVILAKMRGNCIGAWNLWHWSVGWIQVQDWARRILFAKRFQQLEDVWAM